MEKRNKIDDIYERILLVWGYIFFSPIFLVWWLARRSVKTKEAIRRIYNLFNYYEKD